MIVVKELEMNSINKKTKRISAKKITVITTIIVIFVAVISTGYTYKAGLWPFNAKKSSTTNTTNYDPPTKEQTTATGSTKQSSNPTESSGSDSSPSPTPSTTTDQKPSVNMAITAASQANGVLSIRTLIETISDNGMHTFYDRSKQQNLQLNGRKSSESKHNYLQRFWYPCKFSCSRYMAHINNLRR